MNNTWLLRRVLAWCWPSLTSLLSSLLLSDTPCFAEDVLDDLIDERKDEDLFSDEDDLKHVDD